jgi:S-formylglutathione hydrolase FrmB
VQHDDERGTVSRRALIGGGAALAATGAAGAALGPRLVRRLTRGSLGASVAVPSARVPTTSFTFDSAARGRRVSVRLVLPPSLKDVSEAPVCVWLHGRSGSAATVVDGLKVPNYLGQAIADGVPPFAVVAVDGGNGYWHARRSGDDPSAMVVDELPGALAAHGVRPGRWAVAGWSMGGYGALLLAERTPRFVAVAASSAAVWFHAGDTRPGAFDDAEDWAANDVLGGLAHLPAHVRIDCGLQDPFASTSAAMLRRIPGVEGAMAEGAHTMRFWRSVLPAQLAFLGRSLAT